MYLDVKHTNTTGFWSINASFFCYCSSQTVATKTITTGIYALLHTSLTPETTVALGSLIELEFGVLVFMEGGKRATRKKLSEQGMRTDLHKSKLK